MNAVGTHLRGNLINTALSPWRNALFMETVAESGKEESSLVRTRFSSGVESARADGGRDSRT